MGTPRCKRTSTSSPFLCSFFLGHDVAGLGHAKVSPIVTRQLFLAYLLAANQFLANSRDHRAVDLDALLAQPELHVLVARLATERCQRLLDGPCEADDLLVRR